MHGEPDADGVDKRLIKRRGLVLAATAIVLAIMAVSILALSGSSSSTSGRSIAFTDSRYSNGDAANTRHATGSIRGATVSDLELSWTLPITAQPGEFGSYSASPVVADGIVYSQDQDSDVQAIELESGEVLWEKSYESPAEGPNGVVVANGRVYGATATDAFALSQKTGKEVWSVTLVRNSSEQIDMAPGYHGGRVYVSTAPADTAGGEIGVLWALDGATGGREWRFNTVPEDLWGHPDVNYGGGLSYAPAFDARGSMYFGVGNPGPIPGTERHPWGSSRPGPNLYTNSVVKLDAETGKLKWYHQVTPHGLCDWDVGPPVLARAGGRDVVIAAGRSGVVIALDRQTGKPIWRRSVGIHNGHDDDGILAMRGEYSRLKTPMTVYPGRMGGVFAPLAVGGSTVFVPVVNGATWLGDQIDARQAGPFRGELVALDLLTGRVKWKRKFAAPLFGAPTAVNDLVFATTFDGTIYAFDGSDGREMWRDSLPASINAGLSISGDALLAPAGFVAGEEQVPAMLAYRLQS